MNISRIAAFCSPPPKNVYSLYQHIVASALYPSVYYIVQCPPIIIVLYEAIFTLYEGTAEIL